MKKLVVPLLFLTSLNAFGDLNVRFGFCSVAMKERNRILHVFSTVGFNPCGKSFEKCYNYLQNYHDTRWDNGNWNDRDDRWNDRNARRNHGRSHYYCEVINR